MLPTPPTTPLNLSGNVNALSSRIQALEVHNNELQCANECMQGDMIDLSKKLCEANERVIQLNEVGERTDRTIQTLTTRLGEFMEENRQLVKELLVFHKQQEAWKLQLKNAEQVEVYLENECDKLEKDIYAAQRTIFHQKEIISEERERNERLSAELSSLRLELRIAHQVALNNVEEEEPQTPVQPEFEEREPPKLKRTYSSANLRRSQRLVGEKHLKK